MARYVELIDLSGDVVRVDIPESAYRDAFGLGCAEVSRGGSRNNGLNGANHDADLRCNADQICEALGLMAVGPDFYIKNEIGGPGVAHEMQHVPRDLERTADLNMWDAIPVDEPTDSAYNTTPEIKQTSPMPHGLPALTIEDMRNGVPPPSVTPIAMGVPGTVSPPPLITNGVPSQFASSTSIPTYTGASSVPADSCIVSLTTINKGSAILREREGMKVNDGNGHFPYAGNEDELANGKHNENAQPLADKTDPNDRHKSYNDVKNENEQSNPIQDWQSDWRGDYTDNGKEKNDEINALEQWDKITKDDFSRVEISSRKLRQIISRKREIPVSLIQIWSDSEERPVEEDETIECKAESKESTEQSPEYRLVILHRDFSHEKNSKPYNLAGLSLEEARCFIFQDELGFRDAFLRNVGHESCSTTHQTANGKISEVKTNGTISDSAIDGNVGPFSDIDNPCAERLHGKAKVSEDVRALLSLCTRNLRLNEMQQIFVQCNVEPGRNKPDTEEHLRHFLSLQIYLLSRFLPAISHNFRNLRPIFKRLLAHEFLHDDILQGLWERNDVTVGTCLLEEFLNILRNDLIDKDRVSGATSSGSTLGAGPDDMSPGFLAGRRNEFYVQQCTRDEERAKKCLRLLEILTFDRFPSSENHLNPPIANPPCEKLPRYSVRPSNKPGRPRNEIIIPYLSICKAQCEFHAPKVVGGEIDFAQQTVRVENGEETNQQAAAHDQQASGGLHRNNPPGNRHGVQTLFQLDFQCDTTPLENLCSPCRLRLDSESFQPLPALVRSLGNVIIDTRNCLHGAETFLHNMQITVVELHRRETADKRENVDISVSSSGSPVSRMKFLNKQIAEVFHFLVPEDFQEDRLPPIEYDASLHEEFFERLLNSEARPRANLNPEINVNQPPKADVDESNCPKSPNVVSQTSSHSSTASVRHCVNHPSNEEFRDKLSCLSSTDFVNALEVIADVWKTDIVESLRKSNDLTLPPSLKDDYHHLSEYGSHSSGVQRSRDEYGSSTNPNRPNGSDASHLWDSLIRTVTHFDSHVNSLCEVFVQQAECVPLAILANRSYENEAKGSTMPFNLWLDVVTIAIRMVNEMDVTFLKDARFEKSISIGNPENSSGNSTNANDADRNGNRKSTTGNGSTSVSNGNANIVTSTIDVRDRIRKLSRNITEIPLRHKSSFFVQIEDETLLLKLWECHCRGILDLREHLNFVYADGSSSVNCAAQLGNWRLLEKLIYSDDISKATLKASKHVLRRFGPEFLDAEELCRLWGKPNFIGMLQDRIQKSRNGRIEETDDGNY